MRLVAPTTFDAEFLQELADYPIGWLYGSLPSDPAGRAKKWIPAAEPDQLEEHVASARSRGIDFLYTMNATCTGNREFSAEGQRELAERLGWLVEIGAAGVIATNPYVIEMVKRRYPELGVCVSTLANVDAVDKALFYQELGVDVIYVPEYLNRDFRLLKALKKRVRCELVITLNLGCLLHCPLRDYHASYISHASDSLDRGCYLDFSLARCNQIKSATPVEMLKAPWIRPEDMNRYEALGFERFKIAGRENGGQWILRALEAYTSRRYESDLNDLIVGFDALEPFGQLPVRVDNNRLDGFIDFFERKDCRLGCAGCRHCPEWAERSVRADDEGQRYGENIGRFLRRFTSGSFRAPLIRT